MIHTGHKTFDRQAAADCITTGNVWGNVQFSNYIRPFSCVVSNDHEFAPGHLQQTDISLFRDMPEKVRAAVKKLTQSSSVILYEYRHWYNKQKQLHGYVITDTSHKLVHVIASESKKSLKIIRTVLPKITHNQEVRDDYQLDFLS